VEKVKLCTTRNIHVHSLLLKTIDFIAKKILRCSPYRSFYDTQSAIMSHMWNIRRNWCK